MHSYYVLGLLALADFSTAICAGYNFAFFNLGFPTSDNVHAWGVTNDGCDVVQSGGNVCYNNNPCVCDGISCTPPPAHVGSVEVNGLWYACRAEPLSGSCCVFGNNLPTIPCLAPESCCRNDGKRNLLEGRINERQLAAIEATEALLDIQKREYEEAVASGMNERDVFVMREVHKRDLRASEALER